MSHITIAASSLAFTQMFTALRDNFRFTDSDSATFGPFSASYSIDLHLENGSLVLNDDNTIEVRHVKVVWDTLKLELCFELPGFCIPSFCIVPDPWNGCLVGFPGFCLGGPVCIPLNLSGLVSDISNLKAHLEARYRVDPARLAAWTDLQAEDAGHPNKWQIFIDPDFVFIEPIDVPATVANLIENAVRAAIDALLPSWLPGWAKDLILAAVGPILDLVTGLLGIVGSIEDWISDLLGTRLNLLGQIQTAVADYFAAKTPIYEFEDPYPVLPRSGILIPVKIPMRNLSATVNSKEMVVLADVGA